jgi:hypothetical protein
MEMGCPELSRRIRACEKNTDVTIPSPVEGNQAEGGDGKGKGEEERALPFLFLLLEFKFS